MRVADQGHAEADRSYRNSSHHRHAGKPCVFSHPGAFDKARLCTRTPLDLEDAGVFFQVHVEVPVAVGASRLPLASPFRTMVVYECLVTVSRFVLTLH